MIWKLFHWGCYFYATVFFVKAGWNIETVHVGEGHLGAFVPIVEGECFRNNFVEGIQMLDILHT